MNSHAALQVLVVIHLVQTVMMLGGIWALVPLRMFKLLVAGALVGSPIGLLVFMHLDVNALKLLSHDVYEVSITFDALPEGLEAELSALHPARLAVVGNTVELALKEPET